MRWYSLVEMQQTSAPLSTFMDTGVSLMLMQAIHGAEDSLEFTASMYTAPCCTSPSGIPGAGGSCTAATLGFFLLPRQTDAQ